LGACVNNTGKTLAWRWVEHGRFLRGDTPLEKGVFVTRKEAEKKTIYQFAIPLEYLTLKAEPGRKFGFAFAVNDQDRTEVEKSIGPSPGLLRRMPQIFPEAILKP